MQDINLIKGFIPTEMANGYFGELLSSINWHKELDSIDGKKVKLNRKMAYATDNPVIYAYANLLLQGQVWTPTLLEIRDLVENYIANGFNSVLLNLYETGKDEIRWHSDKEEQLGDEPVIACVNLGNWRTFWFLDKATGEKTSYKLENGDLLVMGSKCQKNKLHAILKEKGVEGPRISLTYRKVNGN